jgi:hypothetical protein
VSALRKATARASSLLNKGDKSDKALARSLATRVESLTTKNKGRANHRRLQRMLGTLDMATDSAASRQVLQEFFAEEANKKRKTERIVELWSSEYATDIVDSAPQRTSFSL